MTRQTSDYPIRYYSTNGARDSVDAGTALLMGQAPDRGLFMPERIPAIDPDILKSAHSLTYPELAARLLYPYLKETFAREELWEICAQAYNFPIPLERVRGSQYIMRLDRGPTASFKDFAARFMGRAIGRLARMRESELVILTATSGDTGSAVANAFLGVEGIRVVVLFPIEEVSLRQRKQMTTLGGNITAISVAGKFDDCQALVKKAFADPDLKSLHLSSANSINIGRLLPQSVYYVYAAAHCSDIASGQKVIFSVPSGNFGDMMGGMLSFHGGLPVERFVIGTNRNDEFPKFLESGRYQPIVPSVECISNAMNVGHPSNLARLTDLYGGRMDHAGIISRMPDMDRMRRDIYSVSIDDEETRQTISREYAASGAVLEPHGAVGWAALRRFLEQEPDKKDMVAISLETAHPAKFPEEVKKAAGTEPEVPPSLAGLENKQEIFGNLKADYDEFKSFLQHHV